MLQLARDTVVNYLLEVRVSDRLMVLRWSQRAPLDRICQLSALEFTVERTENSFVTEAIY